MRIYIVLFFILGLLSCYLALEINLSLEDYMYSDPVLEEFIPPQEDPKPVYVDEIIIDSVQGVAWEEGIPYTGAFKEAVPVDAEPPPTCWICLGTVYNLTVAQCDNDPHRPACSGYYLTEDEATSLQYIAVSRNLLSRNTPGAPFDCGEKVYVEGMNPSYLDGYKFVVDVSASKKNHVDFLVPLNIWRGRSNNVRLYKVNAQGVVLR